MFSTGDAENRTGYPWLGRIIIIRNFPYAFLVFDRIHAYGKISMLLKKPECSPFGR
jgi:hypothetical protein